MSTHGRKWQVYNAERNMHKSLQWAIRYTSETQLCLLRWTECFLRPEVHSVSDEHHKVLSIKCLLLNPIKWISFPFHNIIMSQKPFSSALYILFLITSYHGLSYLSQLHCLISLWGKRKKKLLFLVGSFKDILHRKKLVWN